LKVPVVFEEIRLLCQQLMPKLTSTYQEIATLFQKMIKCQFVYETKSTSVV
jgi:hypothetical protein